MKEEEIVSELRKRIRELFPIGDAKIVPFDKSLFGSSLKQRPDIYIDYYFENSCIRLIGDIVSAPGSAVLRNKIICLKSIRYDGKSKPIIIAEFLSDQQRKICHDEDIAFLDLAGNIYLHYQGVYIDKVSPEKRRPAAPMDRNPFSDKASLFLRQMFIKPDRKWGIRELAEASGLSPGYVSKLSKYLEELNYIRVNYPQKEINLRNPKDILDDWVRAYDYRKNSEFKYFHQAKSPGEILDKLRHIKIPEKVEYALSSQAGANLVSPYAIYHEVHIYAAEKDAVDFFVKKLDLREAERGANLIFLLPYYRHSVFYDKQKVKDLWVVSDIQLYLDLYKYPVRGLEQAEHLYEKRLKKLIEQ